jgi:serine/threonine protein kinase
MKKVNGIGIRSPYMMLNQNLAEKFTSLEIDDSIRNLGNVFARTKANENLIERFILENNIKKSGSSSCSKNNSNSNSYKTSDSETNKEKGNIIETPTQVFDINNYIIKKQIGEGSFGKIYLVESTLHNKYYAMKKIVATTSQELQTLKHEYEILLSLLRPSNPNPKLNLVKIHGIQTKQLDQTTYVMYVLMDLASTDWEKEILTRQKTRNYYSKIELFTILKSLISTFAELQRKNISHRDIKPQNILVFHDENAYKIADFGFAKVCIGMNRNTNKQTIRGTELYISPLLFHALRKKCGVGSVEHNAYKSDVYSFGYCALFAASLCYEVLYDIRESVSMGNVRNVVERYIGKRYSGKFVELIMGMLEVNEKMRGYFIEMERLFENVHVFILYIVL